MAAGDVIVQLRALLLVARPFLTHTPTCAYRAGRECNCGLSRVVAQLEHAVRHTSPRRTGRPRARPTDVGMYLLFVTVAGAILWSCASGPRVIGGTTVYVRDTVRQAPIVLAPDTVRPAPVIFPRDTVRPAPVILAPDTARAATIILPPDTVKPAPIVLPPDTVRSPVVQLPPDSIRPPAVTLPPDTVRSPRVVLPPDTIKPPPVRLPPDTIKPPPIVLAPGTPELPRGIVAMDSMLASARASDTVTRRVYDLVGSQLVARADSLGRPVCNRIVQFDSAGTRWERGVYFPCPASVLNRAISPIRADRPPGALLPSRTAIVLPTSRQTSRRPLPATPYPERLPVSLLPESLDPIVRAELERVGVVLLGIMETADKRVTLFELNQANGSLVVVTEHFLTDFRRPMGVSDVASTAVQFPATDRGRALARAMTERYLAARD